MRSGVVVALPLTAMSSQYVIGSFEARFFLRPTIETVSADQRVSRDAQRSAKVTSALG